MYQASGIASAVNGFYRGRDEETARQNSEEDRAYQRTQRQFQLDQQNQQRETMAREEKLRKDIAATPTTKEVEIPNAVPNDDEGNIMPTAKTTAAVPMDTQLRQVAQAYKSAGKYDEYLKAVTEADKLGWDRSTKKFQQLQASAATMTPGQLARAAQALYNDDPMPGQLTDIRDEPDGSVTLSFQNKDTGVANSRTFKSSAEIMGVLHSYYSPATYAKLQESRQKILEEANKPQKLSPGQTLVVGGKEVYRAPPPVGAEYIGDDVNGDPMYRKMATGGGPGGAGAGAGGKGGKAEPGPTSEAMGFLNTILKEAETKQPDTVIAAAQDHVARLMTQNPKLPPAMAARAALEVAKDPKKLQPAINPETGQIDMIFDDGTNGKIAFNRGVADAINTNGIPRETMSKLTSSMLQTLPPQEREAMSRAAFDGRARATLEQSIKAQAEQVISEKIAGATPEQATAVRASVEAALEKKLKALGNNLNLIYNYGSKPASAPARREPRALADMVGGLGSAVNYTPPADSKVGRMRARNEQIEQKKADDEKARVALAPAAKQEAQRLLTEGNKARLAEFQSMPAFDLLDKETKLAIHARVNSIK